MTVMDMVNGVVYNLVQMEREGHVMDRNLVRGVVYMLEPFSHHNHRYRRRRRRTGQATAPRRRWSCAWR
jgi:hypothetical protein